MKQNLTRAILIIACLILTLSLVLVSCKPNNPPAGENPPADENPPAEEPKVPEIKIPETATVKVYESVTLTAELVNLEGDVQWTVENPEIATIIDGKIWGLSEGEVTVTAAVGEVSAACKLNVVANAIRPTFSVSGAETVSLYPNGNFQIEASVTYQGEAVNAAISYVSSDEAVATVSANGLITSIAVGSSTVSVKAEYLGLTFIEEIGVTVFETLSADILANGETIQANTVDCLYGAENTLSAICTFNGELDDQVALEWTTTSDIITLTVVDNTVVVKAVGVGTAVVNLNMKRGSMDITNSVTFNIAKIEENVDSEMLVDRSTLGGDDATVTFDSSINVSDIKEIYDGDKLLTIKSFDAVANTVTLSAAELTNGARTLVVETDFYTYTVNNLLTVTKVFTQADAANFEAFIEANLNGYFILGSDIDFTGITVSMIGDSGDGGSADKFLNFTFDGRGYAMTNIAVTCNNPANSAEKNGSLFGCFNSGSLKNVMIEMQTYTVYWSNGTRVQGAALFQKIGKEASVDNIYLIIRHVADGKTAGPFDLNGGLAAMMAGVSSNCIVDIDVIGVEDVVATGWLFGYDYWMIPCNNHYGITNGKAIEYKAGGTTSATFHKGNAAYATYADFYATVTELPAADGWSSYWSLENGVLSFGGKSKADIAHVVEITNAETVLDRGVGAIATANRVDVTWSLAEPVEGIAIDAKTGSITIDASVAHNTQFTVKASVPYDGCHATKTFTVNGISIVDRTDLTFEYETYNGGDLVINLADLESKLTSNTSVESVTFADGTPVAYTLSGDSSIAIANSALAAKTGESAIVIKCSEYVITTNLFICTKIFTQADVANFEAIIESDLSGYYVLGSDLDFTGVKMNIIGQSIDGGSKFVKFTFDGRGHAMTNIVITNSTAGTGGDKNGSLFGNFIAGSFRNVMVEMQADTAYWSNGTRVNGGALFERVADTAVVENIYLIIRHVADGTDVSYWDVQGGIAALFAGTARNCVVDIDVVGVDNIVGTGWFCGRDSEVYPCSNIYGITNGKVMSDKVMVSSNGAAYSNIVGYETYDAFYNAVTELSAADGWSSYWSLEDGVLSFGGKSKADIAHVVEITNDDTTIVYGMSITATTNRNDVVWSLAEPVEGIAINSKTGEITVADDVAIGTEFTVKASLFALSDDYATKTFTVIDLTAVDRTDLVSDVDLSDSSDFIIKLSDLNPLITSNAGASVSFADGASIAYSLSGSDSIAIAKSSLASLKGEVSIIVKASGYAVTTKLCVCTKIFTQADVANFEAIIESDFSGYYVLGSDLDFTGVKIGMIGQSIDGGSSSKYLSFTFDGRGHAMTNIVVSTSSTATGGDKNGSLFGNFTAGSFRNVMIEMQSTTVFWSSGTRVQGGALFQRVENTAVVENVYLIIRHNANGTTASIYDRQGGIAAMCAGTVRNCVVDIDVTGVDTVVGTGWLFGVDSKVYPCTNIYGITNGKTMDYKSFTGSGSATHSNIVAFGTYDAFYAEVTELSAADGWASYWSLEDGVLSFGGKTK